VSFLRAYTDTGRERQGYVCCECVCTRECLFVFVLVVFDGVYKFVCVRERVCVCVCVCVCAHVCDRECMFLHSRACMRMCVYLCV